MEKGDNGSRRRAGGAKSELIRKVETGRRCEEGWIKVCSASLVTAELPAQSAHTAQTTNRGFKPQPMPMTSLE